jgi:integrase
VDWGSGLLFARNRIARNENEVRLLRSIFACLFQYGHSWTCSNSHRRSTLDALLYPWVLILQKSSASFKSKWNSRLNLRRTWQRTLARAKVPYFRICDLRSTYTTRLSAGRVADDWVTQMLRQGDAQVFKKYSQMKLQTKLQIKREALEKMNRQASEMQSQGSPALCTAMLQ